MISFLQIDLPAMLVGTLAALVCALIGNFLVLTRQSMLGDAMGHVVLPGIVIAFVLAGTTATWVMLATAIWPGASGFASLFDMTALASLPPQLGRLAFGLAIVALVVVLLFKELRVVSFDPDFARTVGIPPQIIGAVVVSLAALAAVVSLSAVGVILLVAMMVCPPATARMLTDDLKTQVWLSLLFALASGIFGYAIAVLLPLALGYEISLGAAGTIAVLSGLFQLAAMLFGPRRGLPKLA